MTRRFHPASFGGVQFDVIDWSDSNPFAIQRDRALNRAGAKLRPRGREARETECQIVFWNRLPIAGEDDTSRLDYFERFKLFAVKAGSGRIENFVHPLTGGFRAAVEDLEVSGAGAIDESIDVTCRFVEDTDDDTDVEETAPRGAGIQAAKVEADAARTELTAVGADPGLLDGIDSILDSWRDPDISRGIAKQLGRIIRTIESIQQTAALASDPNSYAAFRATERLMFAARIAARNARSRQPNVRIATVRVAGPLRQWIAINLGSAGGADTYDRIMALNQIEDPGYLEVGTRIRVPRVDDPQSDYLAGAG